VEYGLEVVVLPVSDVDKYQPRTGLTSAWLAWPGRGRVAGQHPWS
jgi:hypothetical protein